MERLIRLMDDIEDFIVASRFRMKRLFSRRPRERRRSYPRERRVSPPDTPVYPERRRARRA